MGLDMYLMDSKGKNILGYWRKANAIHGWIIREKANHVDECQKIPLIRDDLEQLRKLCLNILLNPERAHDFLPPVSGFFFGSTEIDTFYFEDLQNTVKLLDNVLATKKRRFIYQASW
jgi:hypothetical protein